jgi:hypothetical protein
LCAVIHLVHQPARSLAIVVQPAVVVWALIANASPLIYLVAER